MDETDDNGNPDESGNWLATITDIGSGLAGGIRELVAPEGEGTLIARWGPVVRAGREVLGSFAEIGWYLARETMDGESPPAELLDELSRRTEELIGAFPNVADLYADVDAFDRRLRAGLDKSGGDATLFAYLEWLRGFVDVVIERAVEVALSDKERELTPERATAFLERVDRMLQAVLERWVFPSIIDPGPRKKDEP